MTERLTTVIGYDRHDRVIWHGDFCLVVPSRAERQPPPEWLGIVAFGGQVEKLLQHAKGECVSVSGRVQRNYWTDRDGNEREQL